MADQWLPSPDTPQPLSPHAYYGSSAVGADGGLLPVAAPSPLPVPATKPSEVKRICGISKTAFLLWCVVAFLVVSGAVFGGVFGSGVLRR